MYNACIITMVIFPYFHLVIHIALLLYQRDDLKK